MKTPCYKCKNRHQGCHAECEAYIEWNEANEKARQKNFKDNDTTGFIIKSKEKAIRRK